MPLTGLSKAYRAYIRERRYWRRRQRIEAHRQIRDEEAAHSTDGTAEPVPRAVGGRATLVNRAPVLGRQENRDMPVIVGENAERRPRMAEVFSSEASTTSNQSENESILLLPQDSEETPPLERTRTIRHEDHGPDERQIETQLPGQMAPRQSKFLMS